MSGDTNNNNNENNNTLIVYQQPGKQNTGLDFAFALLGVGMILVIAVLVVIFGLIALPFVALAFLIAMLAGK